MPSKSNMIVDVVDGTNRKIGQSARARLLEEGKNFRTVHVLCFRDHELLLQKLPLDHPRSPGLLGSSVAGYLKSGETYLAAADRKARAEIKQKLKLQWCCRFVMQDQGSMKFVEVFTAPIVTVDSYNQSEIDELVFLPASHVSELINKSPEIFTPTFVEVITNYQKTLHN